MSPEPESLILQLLRDMREKMATEDDLAALGTELKADTDSLRSDMHSLRADVASDLLVMRGIWTGCARN